MKLTGLIAATFSPMHDDTSLNPEAIPNIVETLIQRGISGLYVNGSTGEGPSLSTNERRMAAEAYVRAADNRLPVVIQVGHTSLEEAKQLARHAQEVGADAISATPPYYFKPQSIEALALSMCEIALAAPQLPFYYYHIPSLTGVRLDMTEFLTRLDDLIPNLHGIKFSDAHVHELTACQIIRNGELNLLFGSDEMLLSGLAAGADGAVGSTYNFLTPLFLNIIEAFKKSDLDEARRWQRQATEIILRIIKLPSLPALKAAMSMIGPNCGPPRLPHLPLSTQEYSNLMQDLRALGAPLLDVQEV